MTTNALDVVAANILHEAEAKTDEIALSYYQNDPMKYRLNSEIYFGLAEKTEHERLEQRASKQYIDILGNLRRRLLPPAGRAEEVAGRNVDRPR